MDIFSNCFIHPLFNKHSINRELQAINNEFNLAKNDDNVRLQEIVALSTTTTLTSTPTTTTITPTVSTAPAATPTTTTPTAAATAITTLTPHILRKFGWGNMNSLYDIPISKGIDIQHAACKFHKAYYLPHNAKLVLVSPLSIDESIQLVIDSFSMWRVEPSSSATAPNATDITVTVTQDAVLTSASQPPPAKRSRKSNTNSNNTTTTNTNSNTNNSTNTPTNSSVNLSFPLLTDILAPFEGKNPFLPESYSQITRVVSIKNTHKVYAYTIQYCSLYTNYIVFICCYNIIYIQIIHCFSFTIHILIIYIYIVAIHFLYIIIL